MPPVIRERRVSGAMVLMHALTLARGGPVAPCGGLSILESQSCDDAGGHGLPVGVGAYLVRLVRPLVSPRPSWPEVLFPHARSVPRELERLRPKIADREAKIAARVR